MTVPNYGRTTPLQSDMLALGGVLCGVPENQWSDEDRLQAMQHARESLRADTGEDFGYDISAWHQFLLQSENHKDEYMFHYAWRAVEPKVMELINDPDRQRLLAIAENGEPIV